MNSIKKTLLRVNKNSKTTKEEENPIKKFKNFIFKNSKLGYNGLKKYLIDKPKKVFTQASNNNKIKTLGKWIFYITLVGPCIILAYKSFKYICIRIQRLFERTKEQ